MNTKLNTFAMTKEDLENLIGNFESNFRQSNALLNMVTKEVKAK